jgi:hypothetical protein
MIDESLKRWATVRQKEYIDAVNQYGGFRKAALAMNVSPSVISKAMTAVNKKRRDDELQKRIQSSPTNSGVLYRPIKSLRHLPEESKSILVIPDAQIRADIDLSYIYAIGRYIGHKRPKKIVCLGDWVDLPSLSSYDKGQKSAECLRYMNDVESSITAMKILFDGIRDGLAEDGINIKDYAPEKWMLLGNHEDRADRAARIDPAMFGTISSKDLKFDAFGWGIVPFLEVAVIDGIAFSHYFRNGNSSMRSGFSTAQLQLNKMHMSCIAGHQQGFQMATGVRADGKRMTSIICGSSYDYDMDYLGPQGNRHWRGILMLHNVEDGEFDLVQIPIEYLKNKYLKNKRPMYFAPREILP